MVLKARELLLPIGPKFRVHPSFDECPPHRRRLALQLDQFVGVFRRQRVGNGGEQLSHLHDRTLQSAQRSGKFKRVGGAIERHAEEARAGEARRCPAQLRADPGVAPGAGGEAIFFAIFHDTNAAIQSRRNLYSSQRGRRHRPNTASLQAKINAEGQSIVLAKVVSMKNEIVSSTLVGFSRAATAAVVGSWLVFAICPTVLAADGAKAAAAARYAEAQLHVYLCEKSKGRPDYSKPPASEYLKRIFDTDALATLPAPKADDFGWLLKWVDSAARTLAAMSMFIAKDQDHQDITIPSVAFILRINARAVSTAPIYINSLPCDERKQARENAEQANRHLVWLATVVTDS